MGNPPRSPLLQHAPAIALMLDCLGPIFPFISPGTEMDVGQALQPGETPPCAARNTCPPLCIGTPNLYQAKEEHHHNTFPQPHRLTGRPKEQDEGEPRGRCVHLTPKTAFLT
ncbi:unnamed protein product [Pleuronectes platessa]|uniref:Uncharacterized protein n=1 Tax=Pleuronectes platessa TaxID=8262 RepID=A0A9N7TKL4_PLEPL|nr:unnamed protein product [Pleuronectes platessa]